MVSEGRDARIMMAVHQIEKIRSGEMSPFETGPEDYPGLLEFLANKIDWTNYFGGRVPLEFCVILRRIAGHMLASEIDGSRTYVESPIPTQ